MKYITPWPTSIEIFLNLSYIFFVSFKSIILKGIWSMTLFLMIYYIIHTAIQSSFNFFKKSSSAHVKAEMLTRLDSTNLFQLA